MGRNWTRNLPLKIGVLAAAIAGTLGFYGLIQAHPLDGQSGAAATTSSAATTGDQQALPPAPSAAPGGDQSQPIQQAPPQQTIPRQRVSRGS